MAAAFCLLHGFCSQFPHRLWMYILFIDGDRGTSENRPDPFFASLHVIVFVSFVSCSLSLSPHISVDWWSVHFPACRTYVDLTPQQDTNRFRAHDECNNHCPPTYLPPSSSSSTTTDTPTHRSNDPTLPNANERDTTMVINPTYLAQRTRSCTHSPRPSTYSTLPHSSGGMMMMYARARAKTNEGCFWQPTAATWSDAKQRVLSSYRDWLRAVCLIFFFDFGTT